MDGFTFGVGIKEPASALASEQKPEDVTTLRTNIVGGLVCGPVESEELARTTTIQEKTPVMIAIVAADNASQRLCIEGNDYRTVVLFDLLKVHDQQSLAHIDSQNLPRAVR